jgi:hypothetical protein
MAALLAVTMQSSTSTNFITSSREETGSAADKTSRRYTARKNPIIAKGNANKVCENFTRLR